MGKERATQVQETQRVPNRINPRQKTPGHILIKSHINKIEPKSPALQADTLPSELSGKPNNQINKDQTQRANIKSSKGKEKNNTQGIPIRIMADLSIETLQARRKGQDIFQVLKEKKLQSRLL